MNPALLIIRMHCYNNNFSQIFNRLILFRNIVHIFSSTSLKFDFYISSYDVLKAKNIVSHNARREDKKKPSHEYEWKKRNINKLKVAERRFCFFVVDNLLI